MEWSGRASAYHTPFPKLGTGHWHCHWARYVSNASSSISSISFPPPFNSPLDVLIYIWAHIMLPPTPYYPNYENPTQGHPGTQPSPSRAARPPISPSPVAQLHPSSCPFFWRQNLFQIFSSCKLQDGPTSQYNGTCLSLHLYPLLKPRSKQKS